MNVSLIAQRSVLSSLMLERFVTSHFLPPADVPRSPHSGRKLQADDAFGQTPPCLTYVCALIQWTRQAHALATRVQRLAGKRASVHLFTPCLHPGMGPTLAGDGARIVIHRKHHAQLQQAVDALHLYAKRERCCAQVMRGRSHGDTRLEVPSLAFA